MTSNNKEFPKNFGGALKDALLDASGEKFFGWAWELFEEMPEVKETLKANEQEVYSKINGPHLQSVIGQTVDDIRVDAEQFYLMLGYLLGQHYKINDPSILREAEYIEGRMTEAGILPLNIPLAPR